MKHFPFFHEYKAIKAYHYYDSSWGGRAESTKIIYLCKCGSVKDKSMYGVGFIELEEITPNK